MSPFSAHFLSIVSQQQKLQMTLRRLRDQSNTKKWGWSSCDCHWVRGLTPQGRRSEQKWLTGEAVARAADASALQSTMRPPSFSGGQSCCICTGTHLNSPASHNSTCTLYDATTSSDGQSTHAWIDISTCTLYIHLHLRSGTQAASAAVRPSALLLHLAPVAVPSVEESSSQTTAGPWVASSMHSNILQCPILHQEHFLAELT